MCNIIDEAKNRFIAVPANDEEKNNLGATSHMGTSI
jgi:hypothetical protein